MRAVICNGPGSITVENVPDPTLPSPFGVVVRVEHTAICGSDLHLYHGTIPASGVRLGHEVVGTIVEIGPSVSRLALGDRVLVSGVVGCGICGPCRSGDLVRCAKGMPVAIGTSLEVPGGQAEFLAVDYADAFVTKVPDGVSIEQAVLLTDILPTGYLGAEMANISPGDDVVVYGMGPVGIMALQAAGLFGPARIFAVDVDAERLAFAENLGAIPINAKGAPASLQLMEATAGRGVQAAIEAIGHDDTIMDATCALDAGGTVSVVGVNLNMGLPMPMALVFLKRLTVRAALAAIPSTWSTLIPLLQSGRLRPEGVFTHRMGLSEAPQAYEMFDTHADGCRKILLDPTH